MDTTTKPYYKYKKDAYKKLSQTILGMLKRSESLRDVIDSQFATYKELELFIAFSESKLGSIDIYYLGRIPVGTIILPVFDYDPVRFYVYPDYKGSEYGLVLEQKEAKVVREESLVLFKPSQNSSNVASDGHVSVNSTSITAAYIDEVNLSVISVVYRD